MGWFSVNAQGATVMLFQHVPANYRMLPPSTNMMSMASSKNFAQSFEDLAVPQISALYAHACWMTRDSSEAEDLVQETLTKALRAFDSFSADTNFKAWIFRIQRNTFLTSRTALANSRTVFLEDYPDAMESADPSPTPEAEIIRLDNQILVRDALDQLPSHLREIILLCDVEEFKYKEIAAVLDVPIGTVMSRLSRARHALRQFLTPQFGGKS